MSIVLNQSLLLGYFKAGNVYGDPTLSEVSIAFDALNEYAAKQTATTEERDDATRHFITVMAHAAKQKP